MEKVDVNKVIAFTWDCPKYGVFNITERYCDLVCGECHEEFDVGEQTDCVQR